MIGKISLIKYFIFLDMIYAGYDGSDPFRFLHFKVSLSFYIVQHTFPFFFSIKILMTNNLTIGSSDLTT